MIPVANRIKAARAFAGISAEQLAERIDSPGFGAGTLRAVEQGRRQPTANELSAIVAACGLREDFFDLRVEREVADGPTVGDRLRAARALGGFTSVAAPAEAIGRPGLGERTLSAMEAPRASRKRIPTTDELAIIARACGIPASFFSPDFFKAESENPDVRRLEEKVDALARHLGAGGRHDG